MHRPCARVRSRVRAGCASRAVLQALLVCAIMHKQGQLTLRAVVANGGGQPIRRARLARCVLDHVHADDVPVGIGSAGRETAAQPHEYRLAGYTDVDDAQLHGGAELLRSVLADSADQSLTIVCISSLRDVADLMAEDPAHFVSKVRLMAIQGGLERDESQQSGWAPDSSVNNGESALGARRARERRPRRAARAVPASRSRARARQRAPPARARAARQASTWTARARRTPSASSTACR